MKIKIFFLSLFMAGAIFLLSVRYHAKRVELDCPHEAKAATGINLPFDKIPALKASLEITGGGVSIPSREIEVQLVPKQASRTNSPLLIQLSQVQLNDVPAGNYNLKVTLKRSSDDLVLATLDLNSNIQAGTSIDFGQASWNYDQDPDGDKYNTITEIMNGKFEESGGGNVPNLWVADNTEPSGSGGPGSLPDAAILLRPYAISVSSPAAGGKIRVVGDPFSVQSGVLVKADLLDSNRVKKSDTSGFSRIDGSFDLLPFSNAVEGDKVQVYVSSRNEVGAPSSRGVPEGTGREVEIVVKDLQSCQ